MSAIFGILRFDGGEVSARDLERMVNTLAHRGPDGRKVVADGPVGLGHCLMRVNREDLFERQPLVDREAGLTLVADCRIDNRDQLAEVFGWSAADIRDKPDSAFVLQAYKQWGEDCAEHLLGDFAFAIWDERGKKLLLGRDHMGQRTLLHHHGKDFFAFATDAKALWALPDVPQRLSMERIAPRIIGLAYVRVIHSPGATAFEDIHGLPGATVMTVGLDGCTKTRRYWEPRANPLHEHRDETYYIEAYRRVLGEAVACRLSRLLHPPGLLLSGGYDSAAIAGLAGPALQRSGRKLVTVASVMPADYRGTIRHARRWVEMCARDMPHLDVHYYMREDLDLLTALERGFAETGSPVGIYPVVGRAMMAIAARAGARLIMDGHGGDYTLNPRGAGFLGQLLKTWHVRRFITEFHAHRRATGQSWRTTLLHEVAAPLLPSVTRLWRRIKHRPRSRWRDSPVNAEWAERLRGSGIIQLRKAGSAQSSAHHGRALLVSIQRRLMDGATPGVSATSLPYSVQLSRPFHDKRVVELALAIPQELHVKNGRNRYLACAALKDLYPPEFQTRWRKNDDQIPDFQRMVKSAEPQLRAEIERMEQLEELRRYIDFAKIKDLLAARDADDHNSGWEQDTQLAFSAFAVARFLERTMRRNA